MNIVSIYESSIFGTGTCKDEEYEKEKEASVHIDALSKFSVSRPGSDEYMYQVDL